METVFNLNDGGKDMNRRSEILVLWAYVCVCVYVRERERERESEQARVFLLTQSQLCLLNRDFPDR